MGNVECLFLIISLDKHNVFHLLLLWWWGILFLLFTLNTHTPQYAAEMDI